MISNSSLILHTSSSQLEKSSGIPDTDDVLTQIAKQRKEIENQALKEAQKTIYLLGRSFQALTDDLAKIKTENVVLREEMVQLKITYSAEEKSFRIGAKTIMNDSRQKIQSLVDPADKEDIRIVEQKMIATHGNHVGPVKFEQYQGARSARESFHHLVNRLMGMCDEPQFQQPLTFTNDAVQISVQTLSTFFPLLDVNIHILIKPAVQRFIQERLILCQSLETEVIPVRCTYQSLLKQRESLIFEHQKHMRSIKNTFKIEHMTAIQDSVRDLMALASKCVQDCESSPSKEGPFTVAKSEQAKLTLKICQSVMSNCEQYLATLEK